MDTIDWQRNAARLLLCGTLAAAMSPAWASSDFASVNTAGASDAMSTLVPGQSVQSAITNRAGNSPDFQFVSKAPGQYELTLGTSFFDNLSNTAGAAQGLRGEPARSFGDLGLLAHPAHDRRARLRRQ